MQLLHLIDCGGHYKKMIAAAESIKLQELSTFIVPSIVLLNNKSENKYENLINEYTN